MRAICDTDTCNIVEPPPHIRYVAFVTFAPVVAVLHTYRPGYR